MYPDELMPPADLFAMAFDVLRSFPGNADVVGYVVE
jgi:hypothetical protein